MLNGSSKGNPQITQSWKAFCLICGWFLLLVFR